MSHSLGNFFIPVFPESTTTTAAAWECCTTLEDVTACDYFGSGAGLAAAPAAEERHMLSCRSPKFQKSLQ